MKMVLFYHVREYSHKTRGNGQARGVIMEFRSNIPKWVYVATIVFSELQEVQLLFEGDYYLGCGFYS